MCYAVILTNKSHTPPISGALQAGATTPVPGVSVVPSGQEPGPGRRLGRGHYRTGTRFNCSFGCYTKVPLMFFRIYRARPKRWSPGCVKFVPAVAFHFCLALPPAFTQPADHLLARLCNIGRLGYSIVDQLNLPPVVQRCVVPRHFDGADGARRQELQQGQGHLKVGRHRTGQWDVNCYLMLS